MTRTAPQLTTRKCGFTLVELLVVLAIVAMLVSIIFPVLAKAKERAYLTQCTSNARQIGMAVQMYLGDYDGRFPYARTVDSGTALRDVPTLRTVLEPYVDNEAIWFCPSWMAVHGDLRTSKQSMWHSYDSTYGYNAFPGQDGTLFGKRLSEVDSPIDKPLIWCASGNAHSSITASEWGAGAVGAVNICYVDGHVKLFHGTLTQFTNLVHSQKTTKTTTDPKSGTGK